MNQAVDIYLKTLDRMEIDITVVDRDSTLTSIAISLKRIADALNTPNDYGEVGAANLARAIKDGLRG